MRISLSTWRRPNRSLCPPGYERNDQYACLFIVFGCIRHMVIITGFVISSLPGGQGCATVCCARLGSYPDLLLRPQTPFEEMPFPIRLATLCGVERRWKNLQAPLSCIRRFPLVGRLLGAHRAGTDFRSPFSRSLPGQFAAPEEKP